LQRDKSVTNKHILKMLFLELNLVSLEVTVKRHCFVQVSHPSHTYNEETAQGSRALPVPWSSQSSSRGRRRAGLTEKPGSEQAGGLLPPVGLHRSFCPEL
jgi:hypothetical protein